MMVIVMLRDDGQAADWQAFEAEAAGILRGQAVHMHGYWPKSEEGPVAAVVIAELPDDPAVIEQVREQLAICRKLHGAEQVAWFAPEQIDTL